MKNLTKKIQFLLPLVFIAFAYQNCGGTEFTAGEISSVGQSSTDITVDDNNITEVITNPEKCVSGAVFGIWQDANETGEILDDHFLGEVVVYSGELSAAANYNYYSASAHPVKGPSPKGHELNVFFYEDANGDYAFNIFANIDNGGSANNKVDVNILVDGNNGQDYVMLSDDRLELKKVAASNVANRYIGKFQYWKNTDGGVIGPLRGQDFRVRFSLDRLGDNREAVFYSADGSSFKLKDSSRLNSSFIIQRNGSRPCK